MTLSSSLLPAVLRPTDLLFAAASAAYKGHAAALLADGTDATITGDRARPAGRPGAPPGVQVLREALHLHHGGRGFRPCAIPATQTVSRCTNGMDEMSMHFTVGQSLDGYYLVEQSGVHTQHVPEGWPVGWSRAF